MHSDLSSKNGTTLQGMNGSTSSTSSHVKPRQAVPRLRFSEEALRAVAQKAAKEGTGARALVGDSGHNQKVVLQILYDMNYDISYDIL